MFKMQYVLKNIFIFKNKLKEKNPKKLKILGSVVYKNVNYLGPSFFVIYDVFVIKVYGNAESYHFSIVIQVHFFI